MAIKNRFRMIAAAVAAAIALVFVSCPGTGTTNGTPLTPPVLTGSVSIELNDVDVTGQTVAVNNTLRAVATLSGAGAITFQWHRGSGATWTPVVTAQEHQVQTADVGYQLRVTVTRAGNTGSVIASVYVPDPTALALGGTVTIAPDVAITPTNVIGRVLTANTGSLTPPGDATILFQWMRYIGGSNVPISGANAGTYTITDVDTGHYIFVRVTRMGNSGYVDSAEMPIPLPPFNPLALSGQVSFMIMDFPPYFGAWADYDEDGARTVYAVWVEGGSAEIGEISATGTFTGSLPVPPLEYLITTGDFLDILLEEFELQGATVSNPNVRIAMLGGLQTDLYEQLMRGYVGFNININLTPPGIEVALGVDYVSHVFVTHNVTITIPAQSAGMDDIEYLMGDDMEDLWEMLEGMGIDVQDISLNLTHTTLNLQRGWNTVNLNISASLGLTGVASATASLSTTVPPRARWFIVEDDGFDGGGYVLPPPDGLYIEYGTTLLQWNPVYGAYEYEIFANGAWIARRMDGATYFDLAYVDTPLTPGNTYWISVQAWGHLGGAWGSSPHSYEIPFQVPLP